jgi:hypothetical protein
MGDQGLSDQHVGDESAMEIDDELQLAIMLSMQQVKYILSLDHVYFNSGYLDVCVANS